MLIEPLDLAEAAKKVDDVSGERTDLAKKARAGRVIAAIYQLESSIRWACAKTGAAVLELSGRTATTCAICGGNAQEDQQDGQVLHCDACGAELDRKQNGAAVAWQACLPDRDELVERYHLQAIDARRNRELAKATKLSKMAEGRRSARANRNGESDQVG